jgi:hypothetical protein
MVTGIKYTASECKFCEDGQVIDEDSGGIICKACANGEYRSKPIVNKTATCINCPSRGAQCSGGILKLDDTTWYDFSSTKPLDESRNTYTCFNDESCLYDSSKSVLTCDVSKGYLGPLCGGCDRDNEQGHGSFTRSGRGCAKCFESWLNWLAFIGIGLLALSVLMYLVNLHSFAVARGEFAATVQKIAFSHLQVRIQSVCSHPQLDAALTFPPTHPHRCWEYLGSSKPKELMSSTKLRLAPPRSLAVHSPRCFQSSAP